MSDDSRQLDRLDGFLSELAKHVTTRGILTLASDDGAQGWDVERVKGGLRFGTNSVQNALFRAKFYGLLASEGVGVILRTFTSRRDEVLGLPIKEIRSYFVRRNGPRIEWRQFSAQETEEASGIDAESGKIIPRERAVVFCGPEESG
jgi:hypothetical protein